VVPIQQSFVHEFVRPQVDEILATVDKEELQQSRLAALDLFISEAIKYVQSQPEQFNVLSDIISAALVSAAAFGEQDLRKFYSTHDSTKCNHLLATSLAAQTVILLKMLETITLPTGELFGKIVSISENRDVFMSLVEKFGNAETVTLALDNLVKFVESNTPIESYFASLQVLVSKHNETLQLIRTLNTIVTNLCGKNNRNLQAVATIARFLMSRIEKRGEEKQKIVGQIVESVIGPETETEFDTYFNNGIVSLEVDEEDCDLGLINGLQDDDDEVLDRKQEQRELQKSVLHKIFSAQSSSDTPLNPADIEDLLINLSTLMNEMCAEIEHEKRTNRGDWELTKDSKIARGTIVEHKTSYADASFALKVNLERRQENRLFSGAVIPRHNIAPNLDDFIAIGEQTNLMISKTNKTIGVQTTGATRDSIKALCNITLPFKVLHVHFNEENDRFVAVAGVFEAQAIVLNEKGEMVQQIPIFLSLEEMGENTLIVDVQWLPGSQTLLSVTTNHFVKVYDLSSDTFCPVFNFSPPDDTISSCVFARDGNKRDVITCFVLTKQGTVYYQQYMDSGGPCTLTTAINLTPDETGETQNGLSGGHLYYSPLLQLLIVSYTQGNTIACVVDHTNGDINSYTVLASKKPFSDQQQLINKEDYDKLSSLAPFAQWTDAPDLPGVIACVGADNSVIVFNFVAGEIRFQIIPNAAEAVEGLAGLRSAYGLRTCFVYGLQTGNLVRYDVLPSIKPVRALPPLSRVHRLKKKATRVLFAPEQAPPTPVTVADKSIIENVDFGGDFILTNRTQQEANTLLSKEDNNVQGTDVTLVISSNSNTNVITSIIVHSKENPHSFIEVVSDNRRRIETKVGAVEIRLQDSEINEKVILFFGGAGRIDQVEVFGTLSSKYRFDKAKSVLSGAKSPATPQTKEKTGDDKISTLMLVTNVFTNYFSANTSIKGTLTENLSKIMERILCNRKLIGVRDSALALLISMSQSVEDFVNKYDTIEMDYIKKVSLANESDKQIDFTIDMTNNIMETRPHNLQKLLEEDPNVPQKLYSVFNTKRHKDSIDIAALTKLLSMSLIATNSELPLFDDSELVRSTCARTVVSMTSRGVGKVTVGELVNLCPLLPDGLTAVNALQLLLYLIQNEGAKANEEQMKLLVAKLEILLTDSLFNLTHRNTENDVKIVTLMLFNSILNIEQVEEHQWKQVLVKHVAELLVSKDIDTQILRLIGNISSKLDHNPNENLFQDMGGLLKAQKETPFRNLEPFFADEYAEEFKDDLFQPYYRLLLQVAFQMIEALHHNRLHPIPWSDNHLNQWNTLLSTLTLTKPAAKDIARKLLLKINGEEKYHKILDSVLYDTELREFEEENVADFTIDKSLRLLANLTNVIVAATSRAANWIDFCMDRPNFLPSLAQFTFHFNNENVLTPLKLITIALQEGNKNSQAIADSYLNNQGFELAKFLHLFLFCGESLVRQHAAEFLSRLYSSCQNKEVVLQTMDNTCQSVSSYGGNSKEFLSMITKLIPDMSEEHREAVISKLVDNLESQNNLIHNHPNAYIYDSLRNFIQVPGYYLETEPCGVCNNVEAAVNEYSLKSIKKEIKHDHSAMYVKLSEPYVITSIRLTIAPIKQKSIRTIEFYYNNKRCDANELKQSSTVWRKAASVKAEKDQTDVTVELSIPINAANLLVEFSSFYEDLTVATMCQGCNVPVLDRHGVCMHCGENAHQCRKCRTINYERLDSFLCPTCGHCKYGSFEVYVKGKVGGSGEKIQNEQDCQRVLAAINKQLQVSHNQFATLRNLKTTVSNLIKEVQTSTREFDEHNVNVDFSKLAKIYCQDCKTTSATLSQSQKVLVNLRQDLKEYTLRHDPSEEEEKKQENKCFGCANNFTKLCLNLLCTITSEKIYTPSLKRALPHLFFNIHHGSPRTRLLARHVICLIAIDEESTTIVNKLLQDSIGFVLDNLERSINVAQLLNNEMLLLNDLLSIESDNAACWDLRMRLLLSVLMKAISVGSTNVPICESIILTCLGIIEKFTTYYERKQEEDNEEKLIRLVYKNIYFNQWTNGSQTFGSWVESCKGDELFETQVTQQKDTPPVVSVLDKSVIRSLLLNRTSKAVRDRMASILKNVCKNNSSGQIIILKTLSSILPYAMQCGEESEEFFTIYKNLVGSEQRRSYLTQQGHLSFLATVLQNHTKSLTASLSDLSLGYTLRHLVDIIVLFLKVEEIMRSFKEKEQHIEAILSSFLTLQSMIVQKTTHSHVACQQLLVLTDKLQETQSDKILFIQACIEALHTHKDSRTAQFIFERLCNMISPIREVPQYSMNLKRADSQQHYFQRSMPRNPYSTREVGPLMEDVKKKILREMDIADVFQLELLVHNQIINLKLPVTKVYEQVHKDTSTPMDVIFRFQGVDGEATERMIDELEEEVGEDIEEKCKITAIMSKCGGLEVVIDYLNRITDFTTGKTLQHSF
jgi:E3 ubiquitin-protein ligase UBR4